jgi:hypothetical protein
MALQVLTAPTTFLIDPQFSRTTSNVPGTSGTAVGANTGITVPWVPNLGLQIYTGATACGNVTLISPNTTMLASIVVAPGTSQNILYGPIGPEWIGAGGLVQVNVATGTTVVVTPFLIPFATGSAHSPFELNPQNADY